MADERPHSQTYALDRLPTSATSGTGRQERGTGAVPSALPRLSLRDVIAFLFRRWFLISCCMIACGAIAAGWLYLIPRGYKANGTVLIEHTKQPTLRSEINRVPVDTVEVLQTEIGIITSRTVLERVIIKHGLHESGPPRSTMGRAMATLKDGLRDWGLINDTGPMDRAVIRFKSNFKVEQVPLTSTIRCTYGAEDPAMAAAILTSTMDIYLERRREIFANDAASFYRDRLADNQERIRDLQQHIATTTDRSVQAQLNLDLRGREKSHLFWMAELDRAEAEAMNDMRLVNARVVDYPSVPTRPGLPRIVLIAVALIVGATLGIGGALLLDYLDHSIRDPAQIEDALGIQVLGSITNDRRIANLPTPFTGPTNHHGAQPASSSGILDPADQPSTASS